MMVTEEAAPLEIDPAEVGDLELDRFEVPYVDLEGAPLMHSRLIVGDTEYVYLRSFPIKGHSAVMPAAVAALVAEGRRVLVAERTDRYYVFVA